MYNKGFHVLTSLRFFLLTSVEKKAVRGMIYRYNIEYLLIRPNMIAHIG